MGKSEGEVKQDTPSTGQVLWRRVVEFAAIAALPPAFIYVLGLVTLWARLSGGGFFIEPSVAWQAASLAPRTAVLGYGIGALWSALHWGLITAGLLLLLGSCYYRLYKDPSKLILPITVLVTGFSLGVLHLGPILPISVLKIFIILYLVLLAQLLIMGSEDRASLKGLLSPSLSRWYKIISVVGVVVTVSVVLFAYEPQLPCLMRESEPVGESEPGVLSTTPEGYFLAHTDSHWYVINRFDTLTAIPDDDTRRFIMEEFSGSC